MNLKTNLITLGCFALISFAATQASAETKFKGVGLKLHGSFASANYENGSDLNDLVSSKPGFGGGLQALIELHPRFALQPEVLFVNKGHQYKVNAPTTVSTTVSTNHIQVPILLKLHLPLPLKPKLIAGPHIAYFLSGEKEDLSTDSNNKPITKTKSLSIDDIGSIDLGITAAVGVDMPLDNFIVSVDWRWTRGFLSSSIDNKSEFINTSISLNLGLIYVF